jgi:hypothetical protein
VAVAKEEHGKIYEAYSMVLERAEDAQVPEPRLVVVVRVEMVEQDTIKKIKLFV